MGRASARRAARAAVPLLTAAVLLVGCGEEPLRDDGTESSLRAGAPAQLEQVGIETLHTGRPAAASIADLEAALQDAGLEVDAVPVADLDTDTDTDTDADTDVVLDLGVLAGLAPEVVTGTVDGGRLLALGFNSPDAAIVAARTGDPVFSGGADTDGMLAGNVVVLLGPTDPDGAVPDPVRQAVRTALEGLAEVSSEPPAGG